MEIKNLDDLKHILDLLSEGKASYSQSASETIINLRYNKEKNCIEEYMYQSNPYTGETKERTEVKTVKELFNFYKDYPDFWGNFQLCRNSINRKKT